MPTIDELVDEASELPEEEVYARLGATQLILDEGRFDHESLSRLIPVPAFNLGPLRRLDVVRLGRRLFRRLVHIVREILCGSAGLWQAVRQAIQDAVVFGAKAVAKAVAHALGAIGVAVTVAAYVAALFARQYWQGAIQATCAALNGLNLDEE